MGPGLEEAPSPRYRVWDRVGIEVPSSPAVLRSYDRHTHIHHFYKTPLLFSPPQRSPAQGNEPGQSCSQADGC